MSITTFSIRPPQLDFLIREHLDSPEGRARFLERKFTPYMKKVEQMNQEIGILASQMQTTLLHSQEERVYALEKANEIQRKIERLIPHLSNARESLSLDSDLDLVADAIAHPQAISREQEEAIFRIQKICKTIHSIELL